MTPLRTLVVDNNSLIRADLISILKSSCPDIEVVSEAISIVDASEKINQHNPNLIFFDVKLPDGYAFDVLDRISYHSFHTIFTTSNEEYALKAIRYSPIDFLIKPLQQEDILIAVGKAIAKQKQMLQEQLDLLKKQAELNTVLFKFPPNPIEERIALSTSDSIFFLALKDIIWCESVNGSYTKFHISNSKPLLVSHPLLTYEDILTDHNFVRIHQSYIINLRHVVKYIKGEGGSVFLIDGKELEVSRRRKSIFLDTLKNLQIK